MGLNEAKHCARCSRLRGWDMHLLAGAASAGGQCCRPAGSGAAGVLQPFVAQYRFGATAVAHNGNLVNHEELKNMLEDKGSIFNTSSDTEVILHLIAMSQARPFIARLVSACEQLEGAYSLVFLTEDKLVAVRDPYGFRPLVMGRKENGAVVFASETCALDLIEAKYEREVNPGEVLVVDKEGVTSMCLMPQKQRKACVFEHIYFALPNSIVFGRSVYQVQPPLASSLLKARLFFAACLPCQLVSLVTLTAACWLAVLPLIHSLRLSTRFCFRGERCSLVAFHWALCFVVGSGSWLSQWGLPFGCFCV